MTTAAKIPDRFLAYLIDTLPFWAGYYASLGRLPLAGLGLALLWISAYVLYHAVGNALGVTVGKRLLGLRVVGIDGEPLGAWRCLLRALGLVLSTPLINLGFAVAFLNSQSRALHDFIASSQVVDAEPKSESWSVAVAAAASFLLAAMWAAIFWSLFFRPTPEDAAAVYRAKLGLQVLARLEEAYKTQHGRYTNRLSDLAEASGDVDKFDSSMREIFEPDRFLIKASQTRYLIRAQARDSRRTVVGLSTGGS